MKKAFVLSAILLTLLVSCSFQKDKTAEDNLALPSLRLNGVSYTLGLEGEHPLFIKGRTIELWETDNKAVLTDITFEQKDKDGNVSLRGKAENAEINTDTKSCEFKDSVEMEQLKDNYKIKTTALSFDTEAQTILTKEAIEVEFPDGIIKGVGLDANLKASTFIIGSTEEGSIRL